jgi:hypothetical protein
VGDGKSAVVSRYTDAVGVLPESLYWYTGGLYQTTHNNELSRKEVIVSSERLTLEHA